MFRPKVYFVTGPLRIFGYYLDLVKDTIFVTQLIAVAYGSSIGNSTAYDTDEFMLGVIIIQYLLVGVL